MIPAKPFYLVRHGQTVANASHITAGGRLDSPLNETGIAQAQRLGDLAHQLEIKPLKIIHSPMSRARDTARYINTHMDLPMHEVDDLREHLVGEWEGLPWDEVMPHIKANVRPPGGENKDDYGTRVKNTLTTILSDHDDPVMIVAHGGTFYSILHLYERTYEGSITNCHLHYFEPHNDHDTFPWRIWQYDIEGEALCRNGAPFCSTMDIAKASQGAV